MRGVAILNSPEGTSSPCADPDFWEAPFREKIAHCHEIGFVIAFRAVPCKRNKVQSLAKRGSSTMEEEEKQPKTDIYQMGQDLSDMSVEELRYTVELLNLEIERLEEAAASKSAHMTAAEALFKS